MDELVDCYMSAEGDAEAEEEGAEADGELPPVLEELVGPVVNDAGHQGLHVTELAEGEGWKYGGNMEGGEGGGSKRRDVDYLDVISLKLFADLLNKFFEHFN